MSAAKAAPKLPDKSCCFSFEDLYEAAFQKKMTDSIQTSLKNITQEEKNEIVKDWVKRTEQKGDDLRFLCEDRLGTDGIIYTAFWQ